VAVGGCWFPRLAAARGLVATPPAALAPLYDQTGLAAREDYRFEEHPNGPVTTGPPFVAAR
jgi:hypothetical protein